jgi:hypothetical protein
MSQAVTVFSFPTVCDVFFREGEMMILLRGIQCSLILLFKVFKLHFHLRRRLLGQYCTCLALPKPDDIRCVHFPSEITTTIVVCVEYMLVEQVEIKYHVAVPR